MDMHDSSLKYLSNKLTSLPSKRVQRLFHIRLFVWLYVSHMICISVGCFENIYWNHWTASSDFGTYSLCEQRRFRRACASAQSRQNLRCSLIQAVSQEEPWDRKPDPWPLWTAGHAQLKFVMTECSKTQIRLTGLISLSALYFEDTMGLITPPFCAAVAFSFGNVGIEINIKCSERLA